MTADEFPGRKRQGGLRCDVRTMGARHLDIVVGEQAWKDVFEPTLARILARAGQ
jgi:hypothetical protein